MTIKRHNPKSYAPAVYIPCWLIQVPHNELSYGAKLLYGRLAQWSNTKGIVYRSCPQLSKELSMSLRSIERFINELKDCKLIGTYHPKAGGLNHFEFYDHEWMHRDLIKELGYEDEKFNPTPELSEPTASPGGTPPPHLADININKIKVNKNINNILCTSDEMHTLSDTEKSDYKVNREELTDIDLQLVDASLNLQKSDYHKNQTKKRSDCKLYDIDNHKLIQGSCPEEELNKLFDKFWELYPVKKNKIKSKKHWDRKKLYKIATLIFKDVHNRMHNDFNWQNKQFIPHPSTYLLNELWNDEIIKLCLPKTHQWTVDLVMGA